MLLFFIHASAICKYHLASQNRELDHSWGKQMKFFAASRDQPTRARETEEKAAQEYYGRSFEPVFKKIMKAAPAARREQLGPKKSSA
jgi:hypothetical protein